MKALTKLGLFSGCVLVGLSLGQGLGAEPPPPPPPPPPPVLQAEKAAVDKASKILGFAQDLVSKHRTLAQAEAAALSDPSNETKKAAAIAAAQAVAESISALKRNVVSLEKDLERISSDEAGAIDQEKQAISKQRTPPARSKSQAEFLEELKKRLKPQD